MSEKTPKELYREFSLTEPSVPIFSRAWWLDAVSGPEGWDVVLIRSGGKIMASLPFTRRKRLGLTVLGQPTLTQALGPWLKGSDSRKLSTIIGQETELLTELQTGLPCADLYSQNWHHSRTNWLPFYWAGYTQTTRYTYILDNIADEKSCFSGLRDSIKGDIRKSQGKNEIKIESTDNLSEFLDINDMTFARQSLKPPYSRAFVERLDAACKEHNCRRIFLARDPLGNVHAGSYIIWDNEAAYYLMGGGNPDLRSSGATSHCLWEAIRFTSTVTRSFDFEGSMMQPVERFIRSFGARQVPHFYVSRVSRRMKFLLSARDTSRAFLGLR